ncbi:unnamed protein product, partial [Didymodactylos carnosus]
SITVYSESITTNLDSSASDDGDEKNLFLSDQQQSEQDNPLLLSFDDYHEYQQKRQRPLLGRSLQYDTYEDDSDNSYEKRHKRPLMGRDTHNSFKYLKRTRPLMG